MVSSTAVAENPTEPTTTPPVVMVDRMRRLVQAALVVLTGFMASRVLGVVRSIVIAAHFGTATDYNAYLAAIAVPDTVFQVLVGGAAASAFIPVFKHYLAVGDDDDAWKVAYSVLNAGVVMAGGACLVLAVFARPLMDVLVPGQDPAFRDLAASLTRILLITPALFAAGTVCASVLNSFQRFAVAAMAPLLYNLSIIAGAVFLSGRFGILGLAIGAAVGASLYFLSQLFSLIRVGMRWQPELHLRHPGVREVGRLFLPRMLGLGVSQFNKVLSAILFASFLVQGSMAYLDYAWLMIMTPLALAMAVGTAVFPTLSEDSALEQTGQMQRVFVLSLRMILFLTIPASVGLMVLGQPVVRLFFQRYQFTADATQATAFALLFYAIGLAGHATIEIADRVFYALHDTRTPVCAAITAIVVNVLLSLLLMRTPLTYGGLALATSLAALLEGSLLIMFLSKRLPTFRPRDLALPGLRMLAASLVMGLPVLWLARFLDGPTSTSGTLGQAVVVGVCVVAGALIYGLASLIFQSDELHALRRLVRH